QYMGGGTASIVDIKEITNDLGKKAFDLEKEAYLGTKLSAKSLIKIAQYLGLKIIPSFFTSQIKAIVTDLDNTFYKGILGEDGIYNLLPNKKYQEKLKDLSKKGYMICIVSKNDNDEVQDMFNHRDDFELKFDNFACTAINWNSKAANIVEMAKQMNIGLDSIVFIDDNIAEIENVKAAIPQIKTILFESEDDILNKLNLYPGFLKSSVTAEDLLRSQDIKANQKRNKLVKKYSKEEYFKKLGIKIELSLNNSSHIDRIAELLNKTNQFILSYRRYNQAEVGKIIGSTESCIVTAKMSDNLSDSGIIAILMCKKDNENLLVDELTFSCRALGRGIEDIVISKMLQMSKEYLKTSNNILINYEKGARNFPAMNWLKTYTNSKLSDKGIVKQVLSENIETFGLEMKIL
ncbi:MAG: HAD-IIIC family phosphatase, partial [Treponemataceae bacterium]|nr:HAD-IIIC family phosphatase [Treponemataceae bacterium]